ncbi:MAG: WhiB family transcriptional regulator [Rhodoglobus sp.]
MSLDEDRAALLAAIVKQAEITGRTTPCRGSLDWISSKPSVQARAALACQPCPILALCRQYGLDNPDEIGVYGGLVPADRRPRRATTPAAA